jgi:hypothetical protein
LADLSAGPGKRSTWLRGIAKRLPEVVPGFRPLAEGWLADRSRIDLLGAAGGGAVVVGFAPPGHELETLGRLLAHIHWARPRLGDWLQLSPELGFGADAPVHGVLVGPDLGPEALAAIQALPPGLVTPVHARWVGGDVWLEAATGPLEPDPTPLAPADPTPPTSSGVTSRSGPQSDRPDDPGPSPFRTGLTDADLGLSPAERAELE